MYDNYRDPEELRRIKKNIENAFQSFRDNYERFNDLRRFVFVSSMNDVDESYNKSLQRPSIEFPVLESHISRLRGELSKNEPSIEVSGKDGQKADPLQIEIIEGHIQYILAEAKKKQFEYNCYTDTLTGGFSAAKVYTKYTGEMSLYQDICVERTFDPTMTFWDPMARSDDKSDGRFCGEAFPMAREEFERQFPGIKTDNMKFTRGIGNFDWSYKSLDEDIIVVCDYYEKKIIKEKIVLLANNKTMTLKRYNKLVKYWEAEGYIEQPPSIVGKPRISELTTIVRYRLCDTEILGYEETDYDSLPIIFIDGNSILQKDMNNTAVRQFTRPIVYQARGCQRLKNFAGQCITNELENLVQHKWMVAKESIPEQYKDAYVNVQQASVLVYNAFKDDDPNIPLPPPQVAPRPPIPREIMEVFMGVDQTIQNILGSFDQSIARLGEREVSGKAIQESLSLSNSAAMPYVVSFLNGMQSVANKILELIPKIYITNRTIPILTREGKKEYVAIGPDGISLNYDKNALQVKVEAGANFSSQKEKAYQQMLGLMQAIPLFAQFMSTDGLMILLNNIECRDIDLLKEQAEIWLKNMKESQKNGQNQNPDMIKAQIEQQKLLQKAEQDKIENKIEAMHLMLEKQKMELERFNIIAKMYESHTNIQHAREDARADKIVQASEIALKHMNHEHEKKKSAREYDHKIKELTAKMGLENKKLESIANNISKGDNFSE